jgi:hypothetical protein
VTDYPSVDDLLEIAQGVLPGAAEAMVVATAAGELDVAALSRELERWIR